MAYAGGWAAVRVGFGDAETIDCGETRTVYAVGGIATVVTRTGMPTTACPCGVPRMDRAIPGPLRARGRVPFEPRPIALNTETGEWGIRVVGCRRGERYAVSSPHTACSEGRLCDLKAGNEFWQSEFLRICSLRLERCAPHKIMLPKHAEYQKRDCKNMSQRMKSCPSF